MSGGSGGGQNTQAGLAPWAQPFGGELIKSIMGLVMPGSALSAGATPIAPIPPYEQQALDQMKGLAGIGGSELTKTLGGGFLSPSNNPYLAGTFKSASQELVDQYQNAIAPAAMAQGQGASAGGPGALKGSAFQDVQGSNQLALGKNLENLASDIYGGAYQQERGLMTSALGQVPGIAGTTYLPASIQQNFPFQQANQLGNLLGTLGGSSTSVSGLGK